MLDENTHPDFLKSGCIDEREWNELHTWLLHLVETLVWKTNVPLWRGQEKEIAEEVTQETIMRTFQYSQRANSMEVRPIASLKAFSIVTARNYLHDRRRKDSRMLHYDQMDANKQLGIQSIVDPSEIAVDHIMLATIITKAARIIAHFPPRQRAALLTDLANISNPDESSSLLERALAEEGIQLHDYKQPRPEDLVERQRHTALVYVAYRRLKKSFRG